MSSAAQRAALAASTAAAAQAALEAQRDHQHRVQRRRERIEEKLERGFISLHASNGLRLTVRLGEGEANLEGGFGGWVEVTRPRRIAFTEWQGLSPYRMRIPVLFDGWVNDKSIEDDIRKLERMALPVSKGQPPPTLRVNGAVPKTNLTWVVESLEFGPSIRQPSRTGFNLDRLRQAVSINLLHYESAERSIVVGGSATKNRQASRRSRRSARRPYIVKRGDTLRSIAARRLGSASRWTEIRDVNKLRDPDNIRVGQELKMP